MNQAAMNQAAVGQAGVSEPAVSVEANAMSEPMVQVRNVTKVYERGKQKIEVLHGLTLEIPRGDFVALMGPSGSGKTTLLNLIGGLDQPTSGEISVGGR